MYQVQTSVGSPVYCYAPQRSDSFVHNVCPLRLCLPPTWARMWEDSIARLPNICKNVIVNQYILCLPKLSKEACGTLSQNVPQKGLISYQIKNLNKIKPKNWLKNKENFFGHFQRQWVMLSLVFHVKQRTFLLFLSPPPRPPRIGLVYSKWPPSSAVWSMMVVEKWDSSKCQACDHPEKRKPQEMKRLFCRGLPQQKWIKPLVIPQWDDALLSKSKHTKLSQERKQERIHVSSLAQLLTKNAWIPNLLSA